MNVCNSVGEFAMVLACRKWKECGQMLFGVSEVSYTLNNKATKNLNNYNATKPNVVRRQRAKAHVKGHWFNSLLMKNKNFIIVYHYFQEYLGI